MVFKVNDSMIPRPARLCHSGGFNNTLNKANTKIRIAINNNIIVENRYKVAKFRYFIAKNNNFIAENNYIIAKVRYKIVNNSYFMVDNIIASFINYFVF